MRLYASFCAALLIVASALLAYGSPASDARAKARGVMTAYKRARPACEWCGRRSSVMDRLEAHHVVPCAVDPERAMDANNLVVLCRRCHIVLGHDGDMACRRYVANVKEIMRMKEVRQ